MSNINGKSYAMNVVTPVPKGWVTIRNKLLFWLIQNCKLIQGRLLGLQTLSLIHYARWTILTTKDFPHLDESQPKEKLKYNYMLFFSNFNGSWAQYVDSFSMAIPSGLDLFWHKNVLYPNSVPLQPFHKYITFNQIWTNHYYNAYPLASSNDVKGSQALRESLSKLSTDTQGNNPEGFKYSYNKMLIDMQHNLGLMEHTPIVSLSAQAVADRRNDGFE